MYWRSTCSVAALCLAAASTPAIAQQAGTTAGADEDRGGATIVVTAQRREENVQDVPIAVSAFSADSLQARGISDVAKLSGIAPNVTLDGGTPFSGSLAVRSA